MIKFLRIFSGFLLIYFIAFVTINFYLFDESVLQYTLPLVKEGAWFIFVCIICILYPKQCIAFCKKTKYIGMLLVGIIVYSIVSTCMIKGYSSQTLIDIAIGLKYGIYNIVVFYTAAMVGNVALTSDKVVQYVGWLVRALLWICGIGIVWQGMKFIMPDFFQTILGYGPLGDYVVGQAHPLYYRTGPGGYPRLSGIFSGPNNYGYLLVAYASIIPLFIKNIRGKLLYYGTAAITFSRAAILGIGFQGFIGLYKRPKWRIRSYIIIIGLVLMIIGLSVLKSGSTFEHIQRTWESLIQVLHNPLGVGLGSSGPGFHRGGFALPENFYLQVMIDFGMIAFIARCVIWILIIKKAQKIAVLPNGTILRAYVAGFMGMLIVGLFLHVFEDSVVNYLVFIPFGLLRGSLLQEFAKNTSDKYN